MTELNKANHQYCWQEIGVEGDRTCVELNNYIHCHNCPIYSSIGRTLFDRQIPTEYINQWTNLFTQNIIYDSKTGHKINNLQEQNSRSVLIFRLSSEWFALPTHIFKEVTQVSPIHTIPHRSNDILLGIVNIRGEILLCVSLHQLLGLKQREINHNQLTINQKIVYERMIVLQWENHKWVFLADEIDSLQRFSAGQFQEPPSVINQASQTYTEAIIHQYKKTINYLDYQLMFYSLNQIII